MGRQRAAWLASGRQKSACGARDVWLGGQLAGPEEPVGTVLASCDLGYSDLELVSVERAGPQTVGGATMDHCCRCGSG